MTSLALLERPATVRGQTCSNPMDVLIAAVRALAAHKFIAVQTVSKYPCLQVLLRVLKDIFFQTP